MVLLRIAFLSGALAATLHPAAAITDASVDRAPGSAAAWSQPAIIASAKVRAVEAALAAAKDRGDPIERAVLEQVRSFYQERGFRTLWFEAERVSAQTLALQARMRRADRDGLDPAAYATPGVVDRRYYDPVRLAEADVELSRAAARFVTHVASGRIRPADISSLITLKPERPELGQALAELARAESVDDALARYEPPHPQYQTLKAKLAELRALGSEEPRIVVPEGRLLKPGASDERVVTLRQRLGVEAAPDAAPDLYDEALVEAVEAFQGERGLSVDGLVGPATLRALNGRSRAEDIASIVANMERWRWMPRQLGGFHVLVNVPEFVVRVVDDGAVVHETRVIVGKPENPTPTFSHTMSHLIVNPYWNVPLSILQNEIMPEVRANPYGYFRRHGYEVLANVDGRFRQIDPAWVDWYRVNPRALRVRQTPGSHNALGRIKFMFPNQHSVYLHDTPTKSLFGRDRRAFSHGCVRVQNPFDFADAILPFGAPQWNAARLEGLFGSQERRVNLETPIPVHLSYFTTRIEADGTLRHFEDLYGYDREMTEFLGF